MDIVSSIQLESEEIILKMTKSLLKNIKLTTMYKGGVALNCVVNGKLLNKNFKIFGYNQASGDVEDHWCSFRILLFRKK